MNRTEKLSVSFIQSYLNWIRHDASQISQADRGIFPTYWFYPYQIIIYKNTFDDMAITLKRNVSGKRDKISIRYCNDRIEKAILPNLDYKRQPMFVIPDGGHDIVFLGGTFFVHDLPLYTIGSGAEIRLMNQRIESEVQGYPLELEFVWFFTFPNKQYFVKPKAEMEAEEDFWNRLSSILNSKMETVFATNLGELTVRLFLQYLSKVRDELNRLITRQDLVEQQLQDFLERHYFLLFEQKPIVKQSREIGDYKTDFTLDLNDGSKILVELQLNNDLIIVDGKPSHGLSEAIAQVSDWFKWIEKNDLPNYGKYSGLIIIGRKSDYERNKVLVDKFLSNTNYPIKLKTYDDLNANIDAIIGILTKNEI